MGLLPRVIFVCCLTVSLAFAKVSPRGLENALDISASGVIAQRIRAQTIAENIANMDTTKTETGLPYRRKSVVLRPVENFLRSTRMLRNGVLNGVVVAEIKEAGVSGNAAYQKVYEPNNPDADKKGFVYYPKIDLTGELVEMSHASAAFENNVVVFNNTKAMMQSSLEIGQ